MHTCAVRCRGIILHGEKLLVVKGSHGRPYYALPGGHLDPGESPVECIKRELLEELGITPEIGRLLYVNSFTNHEGEQSVEFFFEVTNGEMYQNHEDKIKTHAHELSEVVWISREHTETLLPKKVADDFRAGEILSDKTRFLKD